MKTCKGCGVTLSMVDSVVEETYCAECVMAYLEDVQQRWAEEKQPCEE